MYALFLQHLFRGKNVGATVVRKPDALCLDWPAWLLAPGFQQTFWNSQLVVLCGCSAPPSHTFANLGYWFASLCCVKTTTESTLGTFSLQLHIIVHPQEKARLELRYLRQELMHSHREWSLLACSTWLVQLAFLHNPGLPAQEWYHHSGPALLDQ